MFEVVLLDAPQDPQDGVWWVEVRGESVTNHRVKLDPGDVEFFGAEDEESLLAAGLIYLAGALGQDHLHSEFGFRSMSFYLPDFESDLRALLS